MAVIVSHDRGDGGAAQGSAGRADRRRHEPRARAAPIVQLHLHLLPIGFSQVTGGLSITVPTSRPTAPPGPYLLFLVNGNGVPSVGRIMLLE